MNLSVHFTLEELVASETADRAGIDNTPPDAIVEKLRFLASKLEQVRTFLGVPIHINSGYRSPELNTLIRGATDSQHMRGEAADFIAPLTGNPFQICNRIAGSSLEFDQLIYEFTWVHLSFVTMGGRHSLLTLRHGGYLSGIVG